MPVANDTETGTVFVVQRPRPNAPELLPLEQNLIVFGAISAAFVLSVFHPHYGVLDLAISALLGLAMVFELRRLRSSRSIRGMAQTRALKLDEWMDESSGWIAGHDPTTTDAVLASPQPTLAAGWRVVFRPDDTPGTQHSTRALLHDQELAILRQTSGGKNSPNPAIYNAEPL
jgi:hypothetical protein